MENIPIWYVVQLQLLKKHNGLFNYRISDMTYTAMNPVEPAALYHNEVVRDVTAQHIRKICHGLLDNPYLKRIFSSNCKSPNGVAVVEYTYMYN